MSNNIKLEIVTPERVLLEAEADTVTIPGIVGELGILPGHIPILSELKSGILLYEEGGKTNQVAIHYGYAQVFKDKITILAKIAELADEIDIQRTKDAHQRAESKLKKITNQLDDAEKVAILESKIMRSLTRQSADK